MSDCCACASSAPKVSPRYRRVLWIALLVNAAMFGAELVGGLHAHSTSLLADAVDFFSDAANYGLSLFVLMLAPVWRPRAALIKGVAMGLYGMFVLGQVAVHFGTGALPQAVTMGTLGMVALCANLSCAALLYAYRDGDANMRSVWLCSRNDAIGNCAVMVAAFGVAGAGARWPDALVATAMGLLAVRSAATIVTQARRELSSVGVIASKA
jgi:Co/Zn/Cd efflux system component